ncbi:phosphate-starvation-inducible PsiE family protein [Ferrimicrobium sp.]|uniref:phosphate-starvation-inducible PsiE family protein n=1 Tax=Ferrimicrobium sp. TaxID=2926050 RepID=UPI00262B639C|nr:phosphate-starvation-inducible PsiE family protein [Ferrimicrobium sp.]
MSNSPLKSSKLANYISGTETVFYLIVALFLALMAAAVLYQAAHSFIDINLDADVTRSLVATLNEILFVIILLELMSTVYNHLKHGGFQLRPFLIIGIVSSVRRILVLGAELSTINHALNAPEFHSAVTELLVETLVVLALTVALYLHALTKRKQAAPTDAADPQ